MDACLCACVCVCARARACVCMCLVCVCVCDVFDVSAQTSTFLIKGGGVGSYEEEDTCVYVSCVMCERKRQFA